MFAVACEDAGLTAVLTIIRHRCRKRGWDEDWTCNALTKGWELWATRPQDAPPSLLALNAMREVNRGRGIAGMGTHFRDIYRKCIKVGDVADDCDVDPAPGPEAIVSMREAFLIWYDNLSDRERVLYEMIGDGAKGIQLAERLGVSAGRITQMRQAMAARFNAV